MSTFKGKVETLNLRSRKGPPQRLDSVFVEGKKQPNGYIHIVYYEEREVLVKFFDTNETDTFSWDELEGNWTDRFLGCYMLLE